MLDVQVENCRGAAATPLFSPSQEYFLQAELTSNVLKTGVVRCCVGQCSNAIPVDAALTMRKLPITYVRVSAAAAALPSV